MNTYNTRARSYSTIEKGDTRCKFLFEIRGSFRGDEGSLRVSENRFEKKTRNNKRISSMPSRRSSSRNRRTPGKKVKWRRPAGRYWRPIREKPVAPVTSHERRGFRSLAFFSNTSLSLGRPVKCIREFHRYRITERDYFVIRTIRNSSHARTHFAKRTLRTENVRVLFINIYRRFYYDERLTNTHTHTRI